MKQIKEDVGVSEFVTKKMDETIYMRIEEEKILRNYMILYDYLVFFNIIMTCKASLLNLQKK